MSISAERVRGPRLRRGLQLALTSVAVLLAAILAVHLIGHHSKATFVGSGGPAAQTRSLPPFVSVYMTGISSLSLQIGSRQSVVVSADNNLLGRITTRVVSDTLVVGNKPGSYSVKTPIVVRVTVPSALSLTLDGEGDITASGIHQSALTLALDGVGTIWANGTATRLHLTIDGAGDAQLEPLTARDATVVINGDSQARLTATNSLSTTIAGNGSVSYLGNPPHVTSTVTGDGRVSRG